MTPRTSIVFGGRRLGAPLGLALLSIAVFLAPRGGELLEYRADAVRAGELWRILTGHWTHGSIEHLAFDAVAFLLLGSAVAVGRLARFWWTVAGSAVAISLVLLLFEPHWTSYRGLSGLDSALFMCLAVSLLRAPRALHRWLGGAAAATFGGKIAFEVLTGNAVFAASVPGYSVVPLAHLVGAAVGLTVAVCVRLDDHEAHPQSDHRRNA